MIFGIKSALVFGSAVVAISSGGALAQGAGQSQLDYVAANARAIFYHELGHALIDVLEVPVLGQEEDAADVLSVLMLDLIFEPETAEHIAYDVAHNFLADAQQTEELAFWDVHGLDEQRFYNFVCLHYGADVDGRDGIARDFELPEERAETCEEERELADSSWGVVLDQVVEAGRSGGIVIGDVSENLSEIQTAFVMAVTVEVEDLAGWLAWPSRMTVHLEYCDEANAFYDPDTGDITMCLEFADYLADQVE